MPDDQWQILCDTGAISESQAPPPPEPTPTPTPTPPAPSGSNVDQFGVTKLYADGPGPSRFMDMNDPAKTPGSEPGSNPEGNSSYYPKFVKNSDGSWQNTNGKEVRWAWCADPKGYPGDSNICKCYDTDNKTGYMTNSTTSWPPRVEMTGFYRADSVGTGTSNGECHIEHVISGHRSTTSNTSSGPGGCQLGCAGSYHCNKYPLTGRVKFEKDYKHSASYGKDISGTNNTTATAVWKNDGKFHGFKDIFYIMADGKTVQLEQWVDWDCTNNWKKVHSIQDDGTKWVPKTSFSGCGGGSQTIAFLFNGPLVVFRADNWVKYSLKNCSVRSIDPTKPLHHRVEHARTFEPEEYENEDDEIYQADEE